MTDQLETITIPDELYQRIREAMFPDWPENPPAPGVYPNHRYRPALEGDGGISMGSPARSGIVLYPSEVSA